MILNKEKTRMAVKSGEWGVVIVTTGRHRGRIGTYDDDGDLADEAVVYFGDLFRCKGYYIFPRSYLSPPTTPELLKRHEDISRQTGIGGRLHHGKKRSELLDELALINEELYERAEKSRLAASNSESTVFLSHASKDKQFAIRLATDLNEYRYSTWLDSWSIKAGESIPEKIESGINRASAVVVLLSQVAVQSKWVEREWQAKYWEEIAARHTFVIPILIEKCEIPLLLRPRKYADFTFDYLQGLTELLEALTSIQKTSRSR